MAAGGPIADVSFLSKAFRSASRNYFSPDAGGLSAVEGAEGFRAQVQTLHRAAEVVDMVVVNRVVTAWYVFAELAWRLRARSPESLGVSGDFDLKTAALFPVDENGRILAELGYGTDLPLIEGREPIGGAATVQHAGASVA
jgi:hypothetical protein